MFQLDVVTYKIGPQCGMRRPTFTFGGGESPYYGAKSHRSSNPATAAAAATDTNGEPSGAPPAAVKQTPSDSGAATDVTSSPSLPSVTSSPPRLSSSSSSTASSVTSILNSKNTFYNSSNGGSGVMLVPTSAIFGTPACVSCEDNQKPRKRKERQDSASSITQERKLVRSNSEERPAAEEPPASASDIRRVVSHEDFLPLHEHNARQHQNHAGHNGHAAQHINQVAVRDSSPVKHGGKAFSEEFPRCDFLQKYRKNDSSPARSRLNDFSQKLRASPDRSNYCEEAEHERRRHTERFSRARLPTGSRKGAGGLKSRRVQRTPRQTSEGAQDENENPQPPVAQQDLAQKEIESTPHESEAAPFPWAEPCDSRPVPSPHAENFRARKCHSNDNSAQLDSDQQVAAATPNRHKKSDEILDVVRMTECHARKYEYHSKALSEGHVMNSNKSGPVVENIETTCFTAPEERLKQISRKLAGLKRRIAKYEETFENQNGYRISQVDKMADKSMKKIYGEIQKLRKEKMRLKIDPVSTIMNYNKEVMMRTEDITEDDVLRNKLEKIKHTLIEIEKRLQEKRDKDDRPLDLELMSPLQLTDEKVALQKALLYFEAQFGRPSTRDERDVAHPLYDRYRQVKRLVLRTNVSKLNSSISELETILEHEMMDFVSSDMSSQPSSTSLQLKIADTDASMQESPATVHGSFNISMRPDDLYSDKLISPNRSVEQSPTSLNSTDSNSTSTSSVHENLHNLPLHELKQQLSATHEEKKQLRRSIKEFEHNFEIKAGRRMQKDDRVDMETTYGLYKQIKAKLRLLEALVNKQKPK